MPVDSVTATIAVVSLCGAAAVAVVTRRHYEPPPPDGEEEAPEPVFETVVFAVLTAGLFAAVGFALAAVSRWGTAGRVATLLISVLGLYSSYAAYTGRIRDESDEAGALIGVVSAAVFGVYPPLFFALSVL